MAGVELYQRYKQSLIETEIQQDRGRIGKTSFGHPESQGSKQMEDDPHSHLRSSRDC